MMKRNVYRFMVMVLTVLTACSGGSKQPDIPSDWKELNLSNFKLMAPPQWNIEHPGGQIESFTGDIAGPHVFLSFHYSTMGEADHLYSPEKDYMYHYEWWDGEGSFPFDGTTKKIYLPSPQQKKRFPDADYLVDLKSKNRFATIVIKVPPQIKELNFKIDSNEKYVFKTMWPKVTGKGKTGIYIHDRNSNFNFQMSGDNLTQKDQDAALLMFKTIQFKQDQK